MMTPQKTSTPDATAETGPVSIRDDIMRVFTEPPQTFFGIHKLRIDGIPAEFGFSEPLLWRPPGKPEDVVSGAWRLDTHDAPVLRYLFRNLKPVRHLEFGTGQGLSTLCCLEECNATVYTINCAGGVSNPSGAPLYTVQPHDKESLQVWADRLAMTVADNQPVDIIPFIGRHYIEKGLGHRVCQIYCDSMNWDTTNFPESFFDTAFIDCGRSVIEIREDTKKALMLVRPGGTVIWYNFYMPVEIDKSAIADNEVLKFIAYHLHWLDPHMRKMFWIFPSRIFVGIRL